MTCLHVHDRKMFELHVPQLQEIRGVSNVIERATQEDMQKKLTDIRQNQDDLRQEQQDLKEHTLNRLDALDEKMEWFLSKGQQGAHPMSDRMSQIEGKLEQQNVTLNILHPMSDRMSQIEQHLQQQNTTLALIKDFLFVSKRFSVDMYEVFLSWHVFFCARNTRYRPPRLRIDIYLLNILIEEVFNRVLYCY